MAPHLIAALAIGVAVVTACDVSQKTPQTGTVAPSTVVVPAMPGAVAVRRDAQTSPDTPFLSGVGATSGERSLRLHGPGVSRKRQTRV
jgi:hypothetical protein